MILASSMHAHAQLLEGAIHSMAFTGNAPSVVPGRLAMVRGFFDGARCAARCIALMSELLPAFCAPTCQHVHTASGMHGRTCLTHVSLPPVHRLTIGLLLKAWSCSKLAAVGN